MARVRLYAAPWVTGTLAEAYYGQINAVVFVADVDFDREETWTQASDEMLDDLEEQAEAMGANAVVGVEIHIDPWWEKDATGEIGCRFYASGTAARLKALY